MKLWRLIRAAHTALDGAGTLRHGGRYSPPGVPVVNFASEAGLAVLVALRYLPGDPAEVPDDYLLGWTESDATPERVPNDQGEEAIRSRHALAGGAPLLARRGALEGPARGGRGADEPGSPRCGARAAARHTAFQLCRMPAHPADEGPLLAVISLMIAEVVAGEKSGWTLLALPAPLFLLLFFGLITFASAYGLATGQRWRHIDKVERVIGRLNSKI